MTPEFSRFIDARHIDERPHAIAADEAERAALARRFGIVAIARLKAELRFERQGDAIVAAGRLEAGLVQSCAVSGEPLTTRIDEPLALRFVHARESSEEEIELVADDCDEIEYDGHSFDLGEAVAQSLALAIDPYAEGPEAEATRAKAGLLSEDAAGPFAALAALRKPN
ncbi:MAG TPA: DUF177 domain-containing protein [Novosphingobium sp.]|nr:DUF177 domain-containing protein [Novosphingobium sp.]